MELSKLGVTFGEYRTLEDWGLKWTALKIEGAKPKTHKVDIPGRQVPLDVTEKEEGGLLYENRKINLEFSCYRVYPSGMQPKDSQISNLIAGRDMTIILGTEPDCSWKGRVFVESSISPENYGVLLVNMEIDAEPYRHWSGDLWPWDSFSFVDGVVPAQNVPVDGSTDIVLPAMYRPGTPKVIPSTAMTITCNGKTWNLAAGKAVTLTGVEVFKEDVTIHVSGTGQLSVVLSGETL